MPRNARIDAPGALHHIIVRGIERRKIFNDDVDRINFLDRTGKVLSETVTKYSSRKASRKASALNSPGADSSEAAAGL